MKNNLQEYIEAKFLERHLDEYLKEQGCNPDDFKFGEMCYTTDGLEIKSLSSSKEDKMTEEKAIEKYGKEIGYLFKNNPGKKMYFVANYDTKISLGNEIKVLHGTYHVCADTIYESFELILDRLMNTLTDDYIKSTPFNISSEVIIDEFFKPGTVSYNIDMVKIDTVYQPGEMIKEYDGKEYSVLYEIFHILCLELADPEKIKFTPTVKVAEMINGKWIVTDKEFIYFDDTGIKCPYEEV